MWRERINTNALNNLSLRGSDSDRSNLKNAIASPSARNDNYCVCVSSERGFTLVEIMVALFIFSILATMLFTTFKGGLDSWRKSEALLNIYEEGRAALDIMSREAQTAVLYQDSPNPRSTPPCYWTRFLGINETDARIKTNSSKDELFFVAPVASNPGRQDLCEIGYWLNSADNSLMRHFEYFNTAPVIYNFSSAASDNKVASNVIDLQFRYYFRLNAGSAPITISDRWDSDANSIPNYDAEGNLKNPDGLPDAVEISITVQSNDGSQKRTFTTLVQILGAR